MEIVGFEDYLIYDDGRVWSKKGKGRFMKHQFNKKGYSQLGLWKDDTYKSMRVHRLIALHYIENPENKPQVDHIDNNRQNNHISNLRWVSHAEQQSNKQAYGAVPLRGVCKKGEKFVAMITIDGKQKYIGIYDTAELASQAYNESKITFIFT